MASSNILLTVTDRPPCTHHNSREYSEVHLPIYTPTYSPAKAFQTNAQVRALNYPHLSGCPQSYVHSGNVEAAPHFSFFAHLVRPLAL